VAQHLIQRNSLFVCSGNGLFCRLAIGICPETVGPGDRYVQSYRYEENERRGGASFQFIVRPLRNAARDVDISVPNSNKALNNPVSMRNDRQRTRGPFRLVGASISHEVKLAQPCWSSSESDEDGDSPPRPRYQNESQPSSSPSLELEENEDSSSRYQTDSQPSAPPSPELEEDEDLPPRPRYQTESQPSSSPSSDLSLRNYSLISYLIC
jgi:hypothetical protein